MAGEGEGPGKGKVGMVGSESPGCVGSGPGDGVEREEETGEWTGEGGDTGVGV